MFSVIYWKIGSSGTEYWYNRIMYSDKPETAAVRSCKKELLSVANDPASVEWVSESEWQKQVRHSSGSPSTNVYIRMKIRAKNAMGGLVLSSVGCSVEVLDGSGFMATIEPLK